VTFRPDAITVICLPSGLPIRSPILASAISGLITDSPYLLDQECRLAPPTPFNDAPITRLSVHFTGREREMDFIQDTLNKAENSRPNCCAVYGMPGVGKSQLILHYAKTSFDCDRYSHIFWISSNTVDKLNQGLAKILDLVGHPDRHLREQSAKLTSARLWLEESHDNWLLVFDNVDRSTVDFLRTHFPRRNAGGHILFTSRTASVANALVNMAGHQDSTLQLRTLERRDSANLLLKDAGVAVTPSLLGRAEELVECVGRLPLAVVQAASFIKETHAPLDQMLELYKSEHKIEVG
jgi:hypothetical protein